MQKKQQNNGYLSQSLCDPQPVSVDTVNEQEFKIMFSIFNRLDIFEIETESSFHLVMNVSKIMWKVLTFTKKLN